MVRGHAREVLWETAQVLLSRTIEQALTTTCAEKCSSSVPLAVVSQYLAGAFLNLLKRKNLFSTTRNTLDMQAILRYSFSSREVLNASYVE